MSVKDKIETPPSLLLFAAHARFFIAQENKNIYRTHVTKKKRTSRVRVTSSRLHRNVLQPRPIRANIAIYPKFLFNLFERRNSCSFLYFAFFHSSNFFSCSHGCDETTRPQYMRIIIIYALNCFYDRIFIYI